MPNQFLSDEWFEEVRKIRDEAGEIDVNPAAKEMKLNIVVTGGPTGDREVHMTGGEFGEGLIDDAPTKVTVPYDVAKQLFIEGNQQAGMQAFMQGQIKVEGDMTRLMAMQTVQPTQQQQELQQKIRAVTE